jgi:Flp pilus assembly protein TadG
MITLPLRRPVLPSRSRAVGRGDRGVLAIELAIMAPFLIVMVVMVAGLGRMAGARSQVNAAAREAARAASLERVVTRAPAAGAAAAAASLAEAGLTCAAMAVDVDTSDYRPGGQVRATVTCSASMAGLGLVFPVSKTFAATAVVPIEQYRSG